MLIVLLAGVASALRDAPILSGGACARFLRLNVRMDVLDCRSVAESTLVVHKNGSTSICAVIIILLFRPNGKHADCIQ
jgi:hypothetical protein